jgi:hypothetical protein
MHRASLASTAKAVPVGCFSAKAKAPRQELLNHLRNAYYRFAREVAPTHFCYEEIADAAARLAAGVFGRRIPF